MQHLTFGQKLMLLRKQKKVSQRKLGEILKITYSNFPKYENDAYIPTAEVLIKLANYFDVSLDYLLRDKALEEDLSSIVDRRLLLKIKDTEQLTEEERNTVINLIDGLLAKHKYMSNSSQQDATTRPKKSKTTPRQVA